MRFLVACDGSELSTLALRVTIHVFARKGDELLVYHVANRGRYGSESEFDPQVLQQRVAEELDGADGLVLLRQASSGELCEVPRAPDAAAGGSEKLMTVHEKEAAEAMKISQRIVDFAASCKADALVMGSIGVKGEESSSYQRTMLGSSARLAALQAPCTVVLVRNGCKVDPKLRTVYMVAVDGSQHAMHALRLSAEWARHGKDEVVCRVFGPPDFTLPVEEQCTGLLQGVMRSKKVEYAVIPEELAESADVHGDELAETANMCRFRQQAFLVFGARGRRAEEEDCCTSPTHGNKQGTTLGHVARWCIQEAQCSLIIARTKAV